MRSTTLRRLWLLALLSTWLLLGLAMTGCCLTRGCPDPEPAVVVVDSSEIVANPDGTYTVSAGWMLRRLEYEQALRNALERCESMD